MYITYLESLENTLQSNSKELYCRSDITDQIQKDNWYEGNICAKYGDTSLTYGDFTPNTRTF